MRVFKAAGCLEPIAIFAYGVVGLLLLAQFGGEVVNYLGSTGWTQVSGTVVSNDVEDVWDTTGDRYAAQVVYTYEVDGTTYEGDQLSLRGTIYTGNQEDAERIVAPYPPGTAVTPYVNPADPTQAVLERDVPGAILGIVAAGVVLLLLSVSLGVRQFASRGRK